MHDLAPRKTPEEEELDSKLLELGRLASELAERELEITSLQAELRRFEVHYLHIVGARYAELDEIEAQIAEALAQLSPTSLSAHDGAAQARAHAQESAQAAGAIQESMLCEGFKRTESLTRLYREVAKQIHPDLTIDPVDRERRQCRMAEANRAYADGDEVLLRKILLEWESSPEAVVGDDIAARLVRAIRKIAQAKGRLGAIQEEIAMLEQSDLHQLWTRVEDAKREGRDLISEMAATLDWQINGAKERLLRVSSVEVQ